MPTCEAWKTKVANDFTDYRLKVFGLVENPVELSLDDLRAMDKHSQITLHHCIQGWSGIAQWGGVPVAELLKLVRPQASATAVVFHSFGEGVALHEGVTGVAYYDSLPIHKTLNPETLLAYDLDGVVPDMSFLEMIDHLNEQLTAEGGQPVAFDNDCREGVCGMCSMVINGQAHGPKRW